MGSKPKAPKKTAQQAAVERRQAQELDREIASQERRLKLQAGKGTTGVESLLARAPEASALPENVAPETQQREMPKGMLGTISKILGQKKAQKLMTRL
tara:strand:+ start:1720 stop:2013 length:294 start_codon:yes stop_codon:yes gene_type:complete